MNLSEREWTVLNALWKTDGAELGVLVNELYNETGWNRNTVLTYLTRMEKKGLVKIDRSKEQPYSANVSKEECAKEERTELLQKVYGGAAGDLISAFLKETKISKKEVEKLRKLLDDMEV